ncbi:MAG: threonine aldolase, partial [Chitinophagaceae bacterium]|nr:threonine aldolase [Chitinophagaceae bacterium]
MNSFAIAFASENYAGVHPEIMQALEDANKGYERSYGKDNYTVAALRQFRSHFGEQADVYYAFNGTGANVFALSVMLKRFEALVCSDIAHVYEAESTAFEALTGCRIFPVESDHGKITPENILTRLGRVGDVQHPQVRAITITQPTEYGTIYSPEELKRLSLFARENNLLLHIDGARLFNAAAALGCSLKEITEGADIITVGGTKSGLMFGEAVVILKPEKFNDTSFLLKRSMHLSSKTRFIACQFEAILKNNLWRKTGEAANKAAGYLYKKLSALNGVKITRPVQTNAV